MIIKDIMPITFCILRISNSLNMILELPENVFIASAWGKIGGGFSGAMVSGYMTAIDALRKASQA